jgi:methionyl-tRNA formyltransferase
MTYSLNDFIFMGSTEFSVGILKGLLDNGFIPDKIFTKVPARKGRGYSEKKSPVHIFAEENNIKVETPVSLKDIECNSSYIIVAAYGLLIPSHFLKNAINVHTSLLPKWRGAAPIHRAILNGDKVTGISIMKMDEGWDTGPILLQEELLIEEKNFTELEGDLINIGSKLLVEYLKTPTEEIPQSGEYTIAKKILSTEELLDFSLEIDIVQRKVRAFSDKPGAYTIYKEKRIKIFKAIISKESHSHKPGTILENFSIACLNGFLYPLEVQMEGKKRIDIESFIKGFKF